MLWIGHVILTWMYFGTFTGWAVAPDVPMALFLAPSYTPWSIKKEWYLYVLFYKLPHSFLAVFCVPRYARRIYMFHILCDILSHTGTWSIQPLYPLPFTVRGIWDPIEWS